MISHWDELPWTRMERGHIAGDWQSLTGERSVVSGVKRIRVDAGKWSTPAHVESSEEEIFYVLSGSGVSWQDGACYDVGAGDCLVHTARTEAHTLRAGVDGLEVLAFGERHLASGARLPRAGVSWGLGAWVRTGAEDDHPWKLEVEAGEPDVAASSELPAWIVHLDDVPVSERRSEDVARDWRDLGRAAGSERTGIKHVRVDPGLLGAVPHCHSVEEELFVVLEGGGELELWPAPQSVSVTERQTHSVREGSVVARPAGTRLAHAFRAGSDGLAYLAYGTRDPNDLAYYPRSNKIFFRGLGLIGRLESLEYGDGEGTEV
ncbi:MAG: cupin domain-containing protein [Gaiellaceae bacterium MAG52_C11]|nr:cupin domain-containing protein [Candidatus Gaiellasilicea maunaloa]